MRSSSEALIKLGDEAVNGTRMTFGTGLDTDVRDADVPWGEACMGNREPGPGEPVNEVEVVRSLVSLVKSFKSGSAVAALRRGWSC